MSLRPNLPVSEQSLHEAAHAVVAAYLKVPFLYVTINHGVIADTRTGGHVQLRDSTKVIAIGPRWFDEYRRANIQRMQGQAIAAMAARVEVSKRAWDREIPEERYAVDEALFLSLSEQLLISDVTLWREVVLQYVESILAEPYVADAVDAVASNLDKNLRVSSQEVRRTLRFFKEVQRSL
jgi:hypothetical protein